MGFKTVAIISGVAKQLASVWAIAMLIQPVPSQTMLQPSHQAEPKNVRRRDSVA